MGLGVFLTRVFQTLLNFFFMEFTIDRAKLVEVQITTTAVGGTLAFPVNLDDLNNATITGVQVITSTQLTTAPSGRPVISDGEMTSLAIIIADTPGSNKKIDLVPLYSANREKNAGRFYTWKGFKWNPSSSKLQILDTGLATTDSVCFMFYYSI